MKLSPHIIALDASTKVPYGEILQDPEIRLAVPFTTHLTT